MINNQEGFVKYILEGQPDLPSYYTTKNWTS